MLPVDHRVSSDLDSTQTVRAVTTDELYDSHRPKWYAIQLVVSDRAVNLDLMPRLEAFVAHRLYAVVGKQNGINQFALRLGFFADVAAAEAICEDLRNYFSSPSIVRVSTAEHERFVKPQAPRATRAPAPKAATPSAAAPAARPRVAASGAPVRASAPPAPRKPPEHKSDTAKNRPRTLAEELLEEARDVVLSRRGKPKAPEQNKSWLSRLLGPKR